MHVEVPVENGRATPATRRRACGGRDAAGALVAERRAARVGRRRRQGRRSTLSGRVSKPRFWEPGLSACLSRDVRRSRVDGQRVDDRRRAARHPRGAVGSREGSDAQRAAAQAARLGPEAHRRMAGAGRRAARLAARLHAGADEGRGRQLRALGPYGGGPAQIAATDRLGLVVDQPGVDGESDTRGAAWTLRASAFRDVVIYFRNNPSILIWEGGNQKVSREHARELRGHHGPATTRTAGAPMRIAAPTRSPPSSWTSASAPKAAARSRAAGGRGRVRPRGIAAARVGRRLAAATSDTPRRRARPTS